MEIKGRNVNMNSLEVNGVNTKDYPDFSDAYFSYGEYDDGTELDEYELDYLTSTYGDVVNEMAHESLH